MLTAGLLQAMAVHDPHLSSAFAMHVRPSAIAQVLHGHDSADTRTMRYCSTLARALLLLGRSLFVSANIMVDPKNIVSLLKQRVVCAWCGLEAPADFHRYYQSACLSAEDSHGAFGLWSTSRGMQPQQSAHEMIHSGSWWRGLPYAAGNENHLTQFCMHAPSTTQLGGLSTNKQM